MRTAAVPVLLAALLPATACGQSAEHQRQVAFVQHCAACHAIARGQPSPVAAAPNLWTAHPSEDAVRQAIRYGAPGMPAKLVHGDNEALIIDYVLEKTAR